MERGREPESDSVLAKLSNAQHFILHIIFINMHAFGKCSACLSLALDNKHTENGQMANLQPKRLTIYETYTHTHTFEKTPTI